MDCGGLDVSGPSPPLLPPLALRSMPPWVVVRAVGALGSLRPATGLQHMGKRCISLWQEGRELLIVAHKTSEDTLYHMNAVAVASSSARDCKANGANYFKDQWEIHSPIFT